MKYYLPTCIIAILAVYGSTTPATEPTKPILCQGHYHSEADAVKQLARMSATYGNLAEWQTRAASIRKQILVGAKLDPLPERTPLKVIIHKKRSYQGYTVESAAFEARPGYLVYGNLYRPLGKKGPRPAIFVPTGMRVAQREGVCGPTSNIDVPRSPAWER